MPNRVVAFLGLVCLSLHLPEQKSSYHDYDTFVGEEGITYLKAYLDYRKRGTPKGYMTSEQITDDSPLIKKLQIPHSETSGTLADQPNRAQPILQSRNNNPETRKQTPSNTALNTQILPHPTRSARRRPRIRGIHDGPQNRPLPRHTNERPRLPTQRILSFRTLDKTENTTKQNRNPQRNDTSLGNEPRTDPNKTSFRNARSHNTNRRKPNTTTKQSTKRNDATGNPQCKMSLNLEVQRPY